MGRNIIGAIIGVIIGSLIVGLIQKIGHHFYPPPLDLNLNDKESLVKYMESMPLGAYMFVTFAHLIGTIIAAAIAGKIAGSNKFYVGLISGIIMLVASITTYTVLPHPIWFMLLDTIVVIVGAFIGAKIASSGEVIIDH